MRFLLLFFWPIKIFAFSDIAENDPQREIFSHLCDVKIMCGADGNFWPEKKMSRAVAVAVALRTGGIFAPRNFEKTFFDDVPPNHQFAAEISRAAELKILNLKNRNFRPNDPVKKSEFLAFLFRATRINFSPFFGRTANLADDIAEKDWFAPHFAFAKKFGIAMISPKNLYLPQKILTRREIARMTFRQLKYFHGDAATRILLELNAQISHFLTFWRAEKFEIAENFLQKISELTEKLVHQKNDKNAVAALAIANSMKHFSASARAKKFGNNLVALENLNLAEIFARRAAEKSESMKIFAHELSELIAEVAIDFSEKNWQFAEN